VTQVKVRALIALAVLTSVAALVGSTGLSSPADSNVSVSTSTPSSDVSISTSTLSLPGFFRGR
jgi:hypothetical protein